MNEASQKELQKILKDIIKNEIRISYHKQEKPLPACSSKIGGKPAVPANFKWPEFTAESYDGVIKSRPLSFMAQINLKETVPYDNETFISMNCDP